MRLSVINYGPAGECTPAKYRDLLDKLVQSLRVESLAGEEDEAIVTTGDSFPTDSAGRNRRLHALRDSAGCVIAFQYHCQGTVYDFLRTVHGAVQHFPAGTVPSGWVPADGTNGVIDLKTINPAFYDPLGNDTLLAHVFVGALTA